VENRRRRGRPPGLVSDTTPADGPVLAADLRAGWLLRSWRLHLAPDSNARSFAATLVGLGRSADASRVSRWETGRVPAPFDVIAAYEEALGLPRGSLVALTMIVRTLSRPEGDLQQVLDPRHVSEARYQAALDVATDGSPRGGDWLDIASFVATHPSQSILPTSVWRDLLGRLVHELALSVGAAYATRNQAALLLSLHDAARRAILSAVGEHVIGNESLVVADAIALLQQMDDPRAGDLVIRLLAHPTPAVRNGAIVATAAKLSRGHFQGEQLGALERTVVGLARSEGLETGGLFARVADVVALLPGEAAERVRRAAPHALATPPPPPLPRAAHSRSRVARIAREVARPEGQPEEPMLERLVEEALTHGLPGRRFQAGLSIALSPYCARVARGAARLLERAGDGDETLAERSVALLTLVATDAQHALLRSLAEDPASPHHTGALFALAHIPPSGVPAPAMDLWALRSPGEADEASVRGAIYYAGMVGDPVLAQVQDEERQPEWVRVAARWWLREGPAIHEPSPVAAPSEPH
jgi:hypothetical protein